MNRVFVWRMSSSTVVNGLQKMYKIDVAAKAGVSRKSVAFVQTTARGSNTMPTRQHPELGPDHRSRVEYDSTQRAALCQEESCSSQA